MGFFGYSGGAANVKALVKAVGDILHGFVFRLRRNGDGGGGGGGGWGLVGVGMGGGRTDEAVFTKRNNASEFDCLRWRWYTGHDRRCASRDSL